MGGLSGDTGPGAAGPRNKAALHSYSPGKRTHESGKPDDDSSSKNRPPKHPSSGGTLPSPPDLSSLSIHTPKAMLDTGKCP
ncbi:hypothetical protein E5288_WYG006335 [Bos mutus]|uniref:Uncharacterized protein n=1 Tax=Bos mutus TaxID=72004 RepID=A0A6B0QR74_9CETA|nr:hypothetical protein [Bos mutus]